jgi:hypothetical protein
MSIRGACGVVFGAAILAMGSLPGRERPVVTTAGEHVEQLESRVAAQPTDVASRNELARAYLDAESPGLAWSTLADSPAAQRSEPAVQHMEARVLIEQGKAKEALALEEKVLATCGGDPSSPSAAPGCDFWLIVSATRRASILQELVHAGVQDTVAQPEASLVAYHNATHEARLAVAQ